MNDIKKMDDLKSNLDWIKIDESYRSRESMGQKLLKKCKDNPVVPIGTTVTVGALTYGLYNFWRSNKLVEQNMMRLRVGAQLITIIAASATMLYNSYKDKDKELDKNC